MESKGIICIVEDNPSIAKLFATILRKASYTTIEFHDASSALNWLSENRPICILADILLPDLNGTELLSRIRKLPDVTNVPVVAITGLAQPGDEKKLLEFGFDGYLSKPINIFSFVEYVENIINLKK
ncbi:MAG: response regulator [Candidatus Kapaibacteriales bacterium]